MTEKDFRMNQPLIADIKRGSLEDGPGIRSVVFFKGCPLQCIFCHNPETQSPFVEIAFSEKDCIRCGQCKEVCPEDAIALHPQIPSPLTGEGQGGGERRPSFENRINRTKCTRCGKCTLVCPGQGLRSIGRYYEVEQLTEILMRDITFYRYSGGGVTLSGGECTMYPDYLEELLISLKANNINTMLETSGYFDYNTFKEKILPYIDVIYYDVKIADEDDHKMFTGRSNKKILDNLRRLIKEEDVQVIPRVPLIPGITATQKNLSAIVNILRGIGAENISLLPYNPMGMSIYTCLGREMPPLPDSFMKPDEEEEVYEMFREILEGKMAENTTRR